MLKAVCRFVVLLLSTFCGLSIFVATFSFALRNFAHYCVILLNALLSDRDKKKNNNNNNDKKRVRSGLLFPGNLEPSSLTPLVCGFSRRDNLLAWRKLFEPL